MKVSTLLTAMALLVGAAGAPHDENLKIILDVIPKLNQSSTQVRAAEPPALHAVSREMLNSLSFSELFCGRSEAPG